MIEPDNDQSVGMSLMEFETEVAYALIDLWECDYGDAMGSVACHEVLIRTALAESAEPADVANLIDAK